MATEQSILLAQISALREDYLTKAGVLSAKDITITSACDDVFTPSYDAYKVQEGLFLSKFAEVLTAMSTGIQSSAISGLYSEIITRFDLAVKLPVYESMLIQRLSSDLWELKYAGLPTMAEMIADGRAIPMTDALLESKWNEYADWELYTGEETLYLQQLSDLHLVKVEEVSGIQKYIIPKSVFQDFLRRSLSLRTVYRQHTDINGSYYSTDPSYICNQFAGTLFKEVSLSPYYQLWLPQAVTVAHLYNTTMFSDEQIFYVVEPQGGALTICTDLWKVTEEKVQYSPVEVLII